MNVLCVTFLLLLSYVFSMYITFTLFLLYYTYAIHKIIIISINIVARVRRQENIEYYEDYYDLTL